LEQGMTAAHVAGQFTFESLTDPSPHRQGNPELCRCHLSGASLP
jgi:hypothetical protein